MAALGMALAALAAAVAAVAVLAVGGARASAVELPSLVASATAWSAGIVLAFGAAMRAVRRDRDEGIVALARARGVSLGAYVRGRVGGLVVVLACVVGGATAVAGIAATSVARPWWPAARASLGALAYALAFAATIGPVALATLGGRSRPGGYLTLLAVLVLPELLAPWTSVFLPQGWHELTSLPAALRAVRMGIANPAAAAPLARALAGLAAVSALSLVVVAARAQDTGPEAPA
jgi:hypothetical protein